MSQSTERASIHSISPLFIVRSLSDAIAFYREKLGFEVQFHAPETQPFFAIVRRDHVSVLLKEIAPEVAPQPNPTRHEWARWDAYVHAPDPDSLFDEFRGRGVSFQQGLEDTDNGLRGFELRDADGYVLFFGRPR